MATATTAGTVRLMGTPPPARGGPGALPRAPSKVPVTTFRAEPTGRGASAVASDPCAAGRARFGAQGFGGWRGDGDARPPRGQAGAGRGGAAGPRPPGGQAGAGAGPARSRSGPPTPQAAPLIAQEPSTPAANARKGRTYGRGPACSVIVHSSMPNTTRRP